MRKALTKVLGEIAESDPRVVLLTADLGFMVLEEFSDRFPSRFFNVGVAEANMVGLATGLASCGYIPYVYSIATFASMRPYEQIRNGPILHRLPVRIVGTGGGFEYGHGGFTHHALEDLGIMRVQPGLSVIVPADPSQAESALRQTYELPGPVYVRLGKNDGYSIPGLDGRFRLGRCEVVRNGSDCLIVAVGSIALEASRATELLAARGVQSTLAVVSTLRPAPTDDLVELMSRFQVVVTVEEHYREGGLGSLVAETAGDHAIACRIVRCGVNDMSAGLCGGQDCLRGVNGLSGEGICSTVERSLGGQGR